MYKGVAKTMTNKDLIDEEVKRLSFSEVLKNLTLLKGFNENTVRTSFNRGVFSTDLAIALHECTSVHAMFWLAPDKYGVNGKRK